MKLTKTSLKNTQKTKKKLNIVFNVIVTIFVIDLITFIIKKNN